MFNSKLIIPAVVLSSVLLVVTAFAITNAYASSSVAARVKGKIVLQVEKNGEAWYINPADSKRYYLGTPDMAFDLMRQLSIGITDANLYKLPVGLIDDTNTDTDKDGLNDDLEKALGTDPKKSDTDGDGYSDKAELQKNYNPKGAGSLSYDSSFTKTNAGKIFLQTENKGQAWYVNPADQKRYFLNRPSDAFSIMRKLGLGITDADLEKIVTGSTASKIPYYFIAIHNEPFHDETNGINKIEKDYLILKQMIAKADEYNIKLTLMLTAQWADYIASSSARMADLAAWEKNGHEISAHHHDIGHGNWDGYTDRSKDDTIAARQAKGQGESYLGTMKDYFGHLKKIDSGIKSGCLNEEAFKDALADEVTYATCSGFLNTGEVGVRVPDTESKKAKNDYITVGNWKNIQRKWLSHYQITTTERVGKAEEVFNSMNSSQVSGSVVHSILGEDKSFYAFLEFLHSKDATGQNSRTVSEIIDQKLIPEKKISDEVLTKKSETVISQGRCGDGICGPVEKNDSSICPKDCTAY